MLNDLIILIAPPASGKTYWIESLSNELRSILVVSPLRALADECREKWGDRIRVVTPEEWLGSGGIAEVVIFDEFHLNYYWGDSFRPVMWEAFYALAGAGLCVFLTATVSDEMKQELEFLYPQFDSVYWCEFGNQRLRYPPEVYLRADKHFIEEVILMGPRGQHSNLIFCQYREEVWKWERELSALGYLVWSCVGGEAQIMRARMKGGAIPHFIVATSVLSHGVNLPAISCVFFLYNLENKDFWIQMVARGGRKGEKYEVFSPEKPFGIPFNPVLNWLRILRLKTQLWVHQLPEAIDQCFLKESP